MMNTKKKYRKMSKQAIAKILKILENPETPEEYLVPEKDYSHLFVGNIVELTGGLKEPREVVCDDGDSFVIWVRVLPSPSIVRIEEINEFDNYKEYGVRVVETIKNTDLPKEGRVKVFNSIAKKYSEISCKTREGRIGLLQFDHIKYYRAYQEHKDKIYWVDYGALLNSLLP